MHGEMAQSQPYEEWPLSESNIGGRHLRMSHSIAADDIGLNSAGAERVPECDNSEKKIRLIACRNSGRAAPGLRPVW
jgi:hypothetical protein